MRVKAEIQYNINIIFTYSFLLIGRCVQCELFHFLFPSHIPPREAKT